MLKYQNISTMEIFCDIIGGFLVQILQLMFHEERKNNRQSSFVSASTRYFQDGGAVVQMDIFFNKLTWYSIIVYIFGNKFRE